MEIVKIDKCGISDDIIKYKLKEWILFHKNNKIIDINNFEIVQNTIRKLNPSFNNGKFIGFIEIDEIIDTNNYENINFDYYDNENKFINYILYNKQLVGIGLIDNTSEYIFITSLLLSDICDWYNIIYNIIMFYNNENKYKMIYINFNEYMDNHPIINDIMNILNISYFKIDYEQKNYYVFKLNNINYNYNNNFNINIIGYKHYTKTEDNLLFNHTSNIGILFNEKQKWKEKVFNKYRIDNLPDIMDHIVSVYDIILEKPIIINNQIDDIFIDIEINLKDNKFKLNNEQPYNLRLNKLLVNTLSFIDYEYIYSISCYYNKCQCNDCKQQYKLLKKDINNKEDFKQQINQYYYGYDLDNYKLYNFIQNNFKYKTKPYNNFEYNKIIIKKPDRQLNLEKLYIIEELNIIEENKKPKNISNNNISNDNYIYLIQKFDVNLNKDLYKFGKTNRHFNERIKEHGKEAKVLIILDVDDCNSCEKNILKVLRNDTKINERNDIGTEYFYCDNKQYIINLVLKNILN